MATVAAMVTSAAVVPPALAAPSPAAPLAFGDARPLTGDVPDGTVDATSNAARDGLLLVSRDGVVRAFGSATDRGSVEQPLAAPIVSIERTSVDGGYWLVAGDGGVFSFGDAEFFGSTGNLTLNQPVVAAATTPSGRGYWLVARDGGVFSFGDAEFFGSTGNIVLNQPIVGAMPTPTGRGYWLVARDGGVFSFGDAIFRGGSGNVRLNEPIVDAASTNSGQGYWLVARDGGVFAFGDATFHGSGAGRLPPDHAAVALVPSRAGYWIVLGPGGARVAIAGDVHGERQIGQQVRASEQPLSEVLPVIAGAHVAAINLETPSGAPGTPQAKQYVFLAPPELLTALKAGGVDVVSLANNHALDHGTRTLLDTIDRARAAGLAVVGAGADIVAAYAPAYFDAPGQRIAFIGLSMVVPPGWAATATRPGVASAYDQRRALESVRRAAAEADHVVVLIHWGTEMARCPTGAQMRLAEALHGAGASVVAGHHPHVLQGIDARPDRVTAYSLGNFVWYHNQAPSDITGILDVTLDDPLRTQFHPARIGSDGRPSLLTGSAADSVRQSVSSSACWV